MGLIIQVAGVDLYNGILPSWPQSETTRGFATRRFRLGPVGKYSIIQVASGDLYKDNMHLISSSMMKFGFFLACHINGNASYSNPLNGITNDKS